MTFPFPYGGITVTVERATYDRFNDATYSDHHKVEGCVEYPSGSTETGQNVGISDLRSLIAPPGADIRALDRIVFHDPGAANPPPSGPLRAAATYQVVGRPKDWTHAVTGWHPGMSVDLEKMT